MFLNCHSCYSFLYGTLQPEELVKAMADLGAVKLVLTDINNTAGVLDFLSACQKEQIGAAAGIEFRNEDYEPLYIGIAQNAVGYHELCRWFTEHSFLARGFPRRAPEMEAVEWIYPSNNWPLNPLPSEWLGIRPQDMSRMVVNATSEIRSKAVVQFPITFRDPRDYGTHGLLRAIDQNALASKLDKRWIASKQEFPQSYLKIYDLYQQFPQAIRNTQHLLDRCSLELDLVSPKSKKTFTPSKRDDLNLLRKLADEGFRYRYGRGTPHIRKRFEEELSVIDKQDFTAYYLITHDMVRYAMSRGFYHVGRGSGANSIVAYCLRITDVDPIELDLYFERFINPFRTSPPDFDIDFSWDERDEVTDYLFKRYGQAHVGLLATFTTFQQRAAIREIGKVFGLPKADIDLISNEPKEQALHHGLAPKVLYYANRLLDLPKNFSIHAGGVLITEEPINQYAAMQMMPKGFPIAQMDMYIAEDHGFHKFDVLSQRGIGHIRDAVKLVRENQGHHIDIHQVEKFKKDPKVIQQLRTANTIGAFYIESPAMRGLLSKLDCDTYPQLVAASSIIRPGVAQSGMMREYIERSHQPEKVEYLHETFKEHLGETYGVMVYQEDVMKIAHHFGGLTMAEADVLRRAMSGKSRGQNAFRMLKDKFFQNCQTKGYSQELTAEVWRQMESFTGYSFCKAHSASFAVESFQSLYLKAYYPLEFMVAVINNFGGFYRTEAYVHEAKMSGGNIQPPCINHSNYLTAIEGNTIYLGFVHCERLEKKLAIRIVEEREQNGPYLGFADYMHRVPTSREQLNILIGIGAFRTTGRSKQELLWEKNSFAMAKVEHKPALSIFGDGEKLEPLPTLKANPLEEAFEQLEILGFPIDGPFDLLNEEIPSTVLTRDMLQWEGRQIYMLGYYITRKPTRTIHGESMAFATWVDHEGHFFDTTHFPKALERNPLHGFGLYLIKGKVDVDFGFPSLTVSWMKKLDLKRDTRF